MLTLYGIPNCDTVKKARLWLDTRGVIFSFHDFKKDGVNAELLTDWLKQSPWEKLVNRAGMTWRNLPDTSKADIHDDASALALMLEKPSVIKRPVITIDGEIAAIGFSEDSYQQFAQ